MLSQIGPVIRTLRQIIRIVVLVLAALIVVADLLWWVSVTSLGLEFDALTGGSSATVIAAVVIDLVVLLAVFYQLSTGIDDLRLFLTEKLGELTLRRISFIESVLWLLYVPYLAAITILQVNLNVVTILRLALLAVLLYRLYAKVDEAKKKPIRRMANTFGITILACLVVGALFRLYSYEQLSDERQEEVLIKAIPFVATFAGILLGYICLIVILAIMLNGRIPQRTHRPIEAMIIVGIFLGVVGLFQPWRQLAFEYGVVLLLVALLSFILWSHITPRAAGDAARLVPFGVDAHAIAALLGVVVALLFALTVANRIIDDTEPRPPYGEKQMTWERVFKEERRAAIAKEKEEAWSSMKPIFRLAGLLPGALVYFVGREVVTLWPGYKPSAGLRARRREEAEPVPG